MGSFEQQIMLMIKTAFKKHCFLRISLLASSMIEALEISFSAEWECVISNQPREYSQRIKSFLWVITAW